jgi:undecaprenyl-diphosphatase
VIPARDEAARVHRRLGLLLALASVPVAVAGLVLKDLFEEAFETPRLAAVLLLATAAVLVGGERMRARRIRRAAPVMVIPHGSPARPPIERASMLGLDPEDPTGTTLAGISVRQALIVGTGQMLALLPGLSRSGTTITAGLGAGLTREAATRFSFLLALPAMVGAAIVGLPDISEPGIYSGGEIAGGVIAAFVAGYAAIAFLVRLVARAGLGVFAIYLVFASVLTFGATFVR